jgi:type IV secretory pathway TraG/TraD family ATPase VirD4
LNPKIFDQLVLQTGSAQLINEYKNFLAYDTKLRTSILATSVAALQIFSDNEVVKVTARDTLQIEDIRKEKLAIFIHCNISDTTYYSVLISIFFEQICKEIMSKLPDNGDRYIQIVLDEFSSMFLPSIQVVISNIRKYMGNILLLCQDYAQIENIYGALDAQAIRNNCIAKLYMAGLSYSVAKDISQELGRFEYTKDNRHATRELLTADEVRTIGADEAILIYGNVEPIRLKLTPYYTNPLMKLRTDMIPFQLNGDAQHNEVVLFEM